MSTTVQVNEKSFACKKKFIQNNPIVNDFLHNDTYVINIEGVDIEPYSDLLTKIFLNQYYVIDNLNIDFLNQFNQKIKSPDLQIKIDKFGNQTEKYTDEIVNHSTITTLVELEELLLNLNENNFNASNSTIENMLLSKKVNDVTLIHTIFGILFPCMDKIDLYVNLITKLDHSMPLKAKFCERMVNFCEKSKGIFKREMCFIINKLIDCGLIEYNGFSPHNPFFMHFMPKEEINQLCRSKSSKELYLPEIKGDNFHQHRIWCLEGKNEHKIAEFIRKDDLELIKKNGFDIKNFDYIPPSIYECHEILGLRAKHAEYAALYGAEKCFDYFTETMKYTSTNDKLARCAIIGGNNNIIKKCIKMNLMTQNCLETAIIYHRNELLEWLIDRQKSFKINSNFYQMSLFHGCFRALQLMVANGTDHSSLIYQTVLNENAPILRWILVLDPDVNIKKGLLLLNACETCKYDMIKLLANYPKSNFNCVNKHDGCTCLHLVCKFTDDVRVIQMILSKMNQNTIAAKQNDGYTALHNACVKGNVDIVKLLIDTGLFNIGDLTKSGLSALNLAAMSKNVEIVRYMFTLFPDKIREFIDPPTIQLCYELLDESIAEMLYEMTKVAPDNHIFSLACEKNSVAFLYYLFTMAAKENWAIGCTTNDFIIACKNGFAEIVHTMIQNHLNINPNMTLYGKTALHYSCKNGMKEAVDFLIENGADVNLKAKRARNTNNENQLFKFDQDDYDDFEYDDEYEEENENSNPEAPEAPPSAENSLPNENVTVVKNSKMTRREARRERREKMREKLKQLFVSLKDPIDKETESYIFNEEDDDIPIDNRKFGKFISEIQMKRQGRSSISIACRKGHIEIVTSLLQSEGIDLTDENLLFDAIYSGSKEMIEYVIDYIEEHNKQTPNQMLPLASLDETPLQFACRSTDDVEIISLVFDHFAPSANEDESNSFYFNQYYKNHSEDYFISKTRVFNNNFDFDYYNNENLNNLFKISIENRHPKTAKFILDKIIKYKNPQILSDCLLQVCKTPYKELVRTITRSSALGKLFEIDNLDDIIYEACMKGRIDNLKVLFKDLDLDVQHIILHQTKNILHVASKSPNPEILEYIITLNNDNLDLNMNDQDGDGFTALMLAAKKRNLRNTEILFFDQNVDRSIVTRKQSIFSLCYRTGDLCFTTLLHQVEPFHPKDEKLILHAISSSGSCELLQYVIDKKIISIDELIKYKTKEGFSCYHTAIMNGAIGIIDKLIRLTSLDINTRADDGRTPLQIAVDSGNYKTVEFLLDSGITSINAPYPKSKQTVLHKAVKERKFDIVCLLLMNPKIDLSATNSKGKTAEEICQSRRIMKMFGIIKRGDSKEEISRQLKELFHSIIRASTIKEKYIKFSKLNQKIRFNYHIDSYEFNEDSERNPIRIVTNEDNFNYRCDSSSSSDDDDEDYEQNIEEVDDEIVFVKVKKNKSKNKRSRARYRNPFDWNPSSKGSSANAKHLQNLCIGIDNYLVFAGKSRQNPDVEAIFFAKPNQNIPDSTQSTNEQKFFNQPEEKFTVPNENNIIKIVSLTNNLAFSSFYIFVLTKDYKNNYFLYLLDQNFEQTKISINDSLNFEKIKSQKDFRIVDFNVGRKQSNSSYIPMVFIFKYLHSVDRKDRIVYSANFGYVDENNGTMNNSLDNKKPLKPIYFLPENMFDNSPAKKTDIEEQPTLIQFSPPYFIYFRRKMFNIVYIKEEGQYQSYALNDQRLRIAYCHFIDTKVAIFVFNETITIIDFSKQLNLPIHIFPYGKISPKAKFYYKKPHLYIFSGQTIYKVQVLSPQITDFSNIFEIPFEYRNKQPNCFTIACNNFIFRYEDKFYIAKPQKAGTFAAAMLIQNGNIFDCITSLDNQQTKIERTQAYKDCFSELWRTNHKEEALMIACSRHFHSLLKSVVSLFEIFPIKDEKKEFANLNIKFASTENDKESDIYKRLKFFLDKHRLRSKEKGDSMTIVDSCIIMYLCYFHKLKELIDFLKDINSHDEELKRLVEQFFKSFLKNQSLEAEEAIFYAAIDYQVALEKFEKLSKKSEYSGPIVKDGSYQFSPYLEAVKIIKKNKIDNINRISWIFNAEDLETKFIYFLPSEEDYKGNLDKSLYDLDQKKKVFHQDFFGSKNFLCRFYIEWLKCEKLDEDKRLDFSINLFRQLKEIQEKIKNNRSKAAKFLDESTELNWLVDAKDYEKLKGSEESSRDSIANSILEHAIKDIHDIIKNTIINMKEHKVKFQEFKKNTTVIDLINFQDIDSEKALKWLIEDYEGALELESEGTTSESQIIQACKNAPNPSAAFECFDKNHKDTLLERKSENDKFEWQEKIEYINLRDFISNLPDSTSLETASSFFLSSISLMTSRIHNLEQRVQLKKQVLVEEKIKTVHRKIVEKMEEVSRKSINPD